MPCSPPVDAPAGARLEDFPRRRARRGQNLGDADRRPCQARSEGVDVVTGLIETHGRAGTARQIGELECSRASPCPIAARRWRNSTSTPRWPAARSLLLVDELAHTNAPGLRHAKRWQDVQELLDAGHRCLEHA